jgi:hypothetical protein
MLLAVIFNNGHAVLETEIVVIRHFQVMGGRCRFDSLVVVGSKYDACY